LKEKNQLKVTLLGTSLMIQSDEDAEHLQTVIQYFEKKIDEVKKRLPATEPIKLAILAGLNIVDELLKIQTQVRAQQSSAHDSVNEAEEVERITRRMIQKLDNILTP
jgi:cell division protein ZapA